MARIKASSSMLAGIRPAADRAPGSSSRPRPEPAFTIRPNAPSSKSPAGKQRFAPCPHRPDPRPCVRPSVDKPSPGKWGPSRVTGNAPPAHSRARPKPLPRGPSFHTQAGVTLGASPRIDLQQDGSKSAALYLSFPRPDGPRPLRRGPGPQLPPVIPTCRTDRPTHNLFPARPPWWPFNRPPRRLRPQQKRLVGLEGRT